MMVITVNEVYFFHDRGPYHIEASPLVCSANQWTGFYKIGTAVMKELISISAFDLYDILSHSLSQ